MLHEIRAQEVQLQTNITLKLEAELIREVRVIAAKAGTSVSQWMATLLEEQIRREKAYDRARRRALARMKSARDLGWAPPSTRDELYDR